jgi:hypothetical protein
LEGNTINITNTHLTELHQLCEEFCFSELAAKLSEFRRSVDFKESEDADGRIAALEEKVEHCEYEIAILQNNVAQLSTDFERFVGVVSGLRSAASGIQTFVEEVCALKMEIGHKLKDPVVEQLSTEFSELRKEVLTQKAQIAGRSPTVTPSQNQLPSSSPPVPSLDSRIISGFPEIFTKLRGKQFSLLWRGSRDGFKAKESHRRCDGHANTFTVILDVKGNVFGGFTPLEWESKNYFKANHTLKIFCSH